MLSLFQSLKAVIPGNCIDPVTEIINVVLPDVSRQFGENFQHGILAVGLILQVFHGYRKNKVAIAVKQDFDALNITGSPEISHQFIIRLVIFCR